MSTSDPAAQRARLENAIRAISSLKSRVAELESEHDEPIAVVGMACRFPGGADTPDDFWRLLREGRDAVTEIPPERWNAAAYYDPDPDAVGKSYTKSGGFIGGIDRFDAGFFGVSPREAVGLDPQHRLLLETSWSALENAGIAPDRLAGTPVGVFVGITGSDYAELSRRAGAEALDAYHSTGITTAFAAGRVAYTLGLTGPAVSVDTACSSSLSAVHLACQSLRAGDCTAAVVGGVSAILTPEMYVTLSRARMLSRVGRCATFSADADGFARGRGAASSCSSVFPLLSPAETLFSR